MFIEPTYFHRTNWAKGIDEMKLVLLQSVLSFKDVPLACKPSPTKPPDMIKSANLKNCPSGDAR